MDVFFHLLYEHSRGLRDLALYTIQPEQQERVEHELKQEQVDYLFRPIEDGRVNVYFGHKACVDVIRSFNGCQHCYLSPEQDFMLGIMLGYDRTRQCERFLQRQKLCNTSASGNEGEQKPCLNQQARKHVIPERDDEHALV